MNTKNKNFNKTNAALISRRRRLSEIYYRSIPLTRRRLQWRDFGLNRLRESNASISFDNDCIL